MHATSCPPHGGTSGEYGQRDQKVKKPALLRWLGVTASLLLACNARAVLAQTPSPLQEWQYSGGVILARLFEPDLPRWRTILGAGGALPPVYDGARAMKVSGGPDINVYYKDEWYVST